MKRAFYLAVLIIFGFATTVYGQVKGFSAEQLIELVKKNHPIAKQADLIVDKAKAEVLAARGNFDPQLRNETGQKSFGTDMYYYYNRPKLEIPTWGGVEISAGTSYLSGAKTDPEDTRGSSHFWGISVPLAKDLLMDKRRAMLRTAQIYRQASEYERKALLNDILLEALRVYWNWSQQFQVCKILEDALVINRQRVEWVKTGYRLGDRAAIDTVEAITQLQQLELQFNQAQMEFQNNRYELSSFLWNDNQEPVDLDSSLVPANETVLLERLNDPLSSLLELSTLQHPELMQYPFKLKALEVEKKWKFQELLPEARFQYNQLGKGFNILGADSGPLFGNNFQYGLSLGIPLRLSKGRAEYRKAKLKILETRLQQDNKQVMIQMKIRSIYNEWQTLRRQVELQQQTLNNFIALQRAEESRLRNGESSLFLVNARENKSLEARQKLQELKNKFSFTGYKLLWSIGSLGTSTP